MATIRKRGSKWQVRVRRIGSLPISKTFIRKEDANLWARQTEIAADRRDLPVDTQSLAEVTVADLLCRYRDTVVPKKRGADVETFILNAFLRDDGIARLSLSELSPLHLSRYRDERLERVKPVTLSRKLGIIQHAFEIARNEWGIPLLENPLARVKKPSQFTRRDRRIEACLVGMEACATSHQ